VAALVLDRHSPTLQLRAKIPGFDPIWLWEKTGLSFELRQRIEVQEVTERSADRSPD
jgi:hypothetical protein